jgi:hypothetical protein
MTQLEAREQSEKDVTDPRVTDPNTLTLSDHGPYELYVVTTTEGKAQLTLTNTDTNEVMLDHEVDAPLEDDGMVAYEVWSPWFHEAEAAMAATGYEPLADGHPSV